MLNLFHRDEGTVRHFWARSSSTHLDPGQDPVHNGTIESVWNLFDLTPEGRPDRLGGAGEPLVTRRRAFKHESSLTSVPASRQAPRAL